MSHSGGARFTGYARRRMMSGMRGEAVGAITLQSTC